MTNDAVSIKADLSAIKGLATKLSKDWPEALALAVNRTTEEGQLAIKANVSRSFRLRRADFVLRTIKWNRQDRADFKAGKLSARLHVDDKVDSKGRSRDWLAKFEDGGVKRPESGKLLAVPVEARPNQEALVPRNLLVPNLRIAPKVTKKGGRQYKGRLRTVLQNSAIIQYVTGGASRVLYVLKPSVPIRPLLKFHATFQETVDKKWRANLEGFLDYVHNRKR